MSPLRLIIFGDIFLKTILFSGGHGLPIKFNYTLKTKLLDSMSLSDPSIDEELEPLNWEERKWLTKEYIKSVETKSTIHKIPITVNNLYSTLKPFIDEHCLIVINNFEQTDINPTIYLPLILRHFEIAYGRVDYIDAETYENQSEMDLIWVPKEMVSKLNGNFSTDQPNKIFFGGYRATCLIWKYVYSIWPEDKHSQLCLGSKSFNFVMKSRPLQCEVQIDLMMPDNLLRLRKHTEMFNSLDFHWKNIAPSLRPRVYILIDTKQSLEEYDWLSLATWALRKNYKHVIHTDNHLQVTGHLKCIKKLKDIEINLECNINVWNVIFLCPECLNLISAKVLQPDVLSFDTLNELDKLQKQIAFPGEIENPSDNKLSTAIAKYLNDHRPEEKSKLLNWPPKNLHLLKLRSWEKEKMLGFAYASIFIRFMGNLTLRTKEGVWMPEIGYSKPHFQRVAFIYDLATPVYDTMIRIQNEFGRLSLVSCGSRGIEPFPFLQFVSVFKLEVWIFILIAVSVLSVYIVKLYKNSHRSVFQLTGTFGMYKLLLEQGNPFPSNFDKSLKVRFVMAGTLLAGLVISNAFKSENVYTIVLPRSQISYFKVDELIEDNITVNGRIQSFEYHWIYPRKCKPAYIYNISNYLYMCKDSGLLLYGFIETLSGSGPESEKIKSYARIHPYSLKAIREPIDYIVDLVKIGLFNSTDGFNYIDEKPLNELYLKKQEDIIRRDLNECNKSAWVLPNYLAQLLHRSLKKSGKHSDVISNAYTTPEINFNYNFAYVPSSILKEISLIQNTGLLEWWPKFINRSDHNIANEHIKPKKPNMSGNILVIFVFLGGGLFIALACMILELRKVIFESVTKSCKACVRNLHHIRAFLDNK